jgi:hypothetical protein
MVVRFSGRCFRDSRGQALAGIQARLKNAFYPTYQEELASAGTPGGRWRGQLLGRRIDRELKSATTLIRSVRGRRMLANKMMLPSGRGGGFHKDTKALLAYFRNKRWELHKAQVAVGGRRHAGLGTAIDLVVKDNTKDGRLRAIEIKTGFGAYFGRSLGRFSAPLHRVGNSPLNQAVLQLITGMELARRSGGVELASIALGSVVRVNGAIVEGWDLTQFDWMLSALNAVKQELLE